ncbi:hypothetical protein D3C81_1570370 [compost metagenome]
MLFLGQTTPLNQCQRQGDEAGHQNRMQNEDADIQAQEVGMTQGRPQRLLRHTRLAVLQRTVRRRHDKRNQGNTHHGHGGSGHK